MYCKERGDSSVYKFIYPLMGSKTPPQNSAKAKKLGGDQLPINPIGSTNN